MKLAEQTERFVKRGAEVSEWAEMGHALNLTDKMGPGGDAFKAAEGVGTAYEGVNKMREGHYVDGTIDLVEGAGNTVSGAGAMAGSEIAGPAAGVAGLGEMARGLREIQKDKYDGDGYVDLLAGAGDTMGGFMEHTPAGQVAKAGAFGLKLGKKMRHFSDDHAKSNNWYGIDPETGRPMTGTDDATRTGRSVDKWLDDHTGSDLVGDIGGYSAAIGKGLWNAFSGVPRGLAEDAWGGITGNSHNLVGDAMFDRVDATRAALNKHKVQERKQKKTVDGNLASLLLSQQMTKLSMLKAGAQAGSSPFEGMYD